MSSVVVVVKEGRVPAPPEQVWATLARLDDISRWAGNVDHSTYTTTATEGVGAARRVQVGRNALIETVTMWTPPTTLAYTLDGLPPLARSVVNRWDLAAVAGDPSATQVSLSTEITPLAGPRGRIGLRVLGVLLAKASDAMLAGLADPATWAPRGVDA